MQQHLWRFLAAALVGLCVGCPDGGGAAAAPTPGPAAGSGAAGFAERIKIKLGDGSTTFEFKLMDDGGKIVDASEAERFRLKAKEGKVKLRDPADQVLGYVKFSDGRFKVKDASQEHDLFTFQQQEDGDWKLKNEQDQQLYEVKQRDYGWTVRDAEEVDLFKVKVKDGKTSLRGADDQTRYSTKDPVSPLAFVALGFDALDEGQRLALWYQIQAAGK